jgi:hypothetical protein
MKKLTLAQIIAIGSPTQVVVRSHGYYVYTVEVAVGEQLYLIADGKGKTLQYREMAAIKQQFRDLDCTPNQALLVQDTTYAEMIGLDAEPPRAMVTPLHWGTDL